MDVEEFEFDDLRACVDPDLGHLCEAPTRCWKLADGVNRLTAATPTSGEEPNGWGRPSSQMSRGFADPETEVVHDVFVRDNLDVSPKRCVALEEAVEQIIRVLSTQMPAAATATARSSTMASSMAAWV